MGRSKQRNWQSSFESYGFRQLVAAAVNLNMASFVSICSVARPASDQFGFSRAKPAQ
jgi:hypothetical protein